MGTCCGSTFPAVDVTFIGDDCWYHIFSNCTLQEFIQMRQICQHFHNLTDPTLGVYQQFWICQCRLYCEDFDNANKSIEFKSKYNDHDDSTKNRQVVLNGSAFYFFKELHQFYSNTILSRENARISLLENSDTRLKYYTETSKLVSVHNPIIYSIKHDYVEIFKFLMTNIKWEKYYQDSNNPNNSNNSKESKQKHNNWQDYNYNIKKNEIDTYGIPVNMYFPRTHGIRNRRGFSLFEKACEMKSNKICQYLLNFNCLELSNQCDGHPNDTENNYYTPFISSIMTNNDQLFKTILNHPNFKNLIEKYKFNPNNIVGKQENVLTMTPLHHAVCCKNSNIVKLLIDDCEVDVNIVNQMGEAPLHLGCQARYADSKIIQLLLNCQNIDINKKNLNKKDMTPFQIACQQCTHKTHRREIDLSIVKLIGDDDRCDILATDKKQWNCLMYAIQNEYYRRNNSYFDEDFLSYQWAYQCIKYIHKRLMNGIKENKYNQSQVNEFFNQRGLPLGRTAFIMAYQMAYDDVLRYLKHLCKVDTTIDPKFKLRNKALHERLINI